MAAANHGDYGSAVGGEARKPDWDLLFVYSKALPPYVSLAQLSREQGRDPVEIMIDLALATDFRQLFLQLLKKSNPDGALAILSHPRTVMTFSDTGAHVGQISDCSIHTQLLAYWVRERQAFSLEEGVRMVSLAPARAWGFADRGLVREGMRADLNVFDPATISPQLPEVVADLPGGASRLIQHSTGLAATVVAGKVVFRDGVHSGALPGRLLRRGAAALTA